MAQVVHLACARCGHREIVALETAEKDVAVAEADRASSDPAMTGEGAAASELRRLQRLKSLPTSLPVGGIITPV